MRRPSPVQIAVVELIMLGLVEVVPGSNPPRYRATARGRDPSPTLPLQLGRRLASRAKRGPLNGHCEDEGDGEGGEHDSP